MRELEALRATDFEWAEHVEGIWSEPVWDVPEIHQKAREELSRRIDLLKTREASPLGVPLVGEAGSGKTHLLCALRKTAFEKGAGFVLLDMTDVNDFWATAQLGFLSSLRRPGPSGREQYFEVLQHVFEHHVGAGSGLVDATTIARLPPDKLADRIKVMVAEMAKNPQGMVFRDAIRALALIDSADFETASTGYGWLQGLGIDPAEKARYGFGQDAMAPSQVLKALAWLFTLKGPLVIALDQIDAIVAEHNIASGPFTDDPVLAGRQQVSRAIIEGIASGLMALREISRRTLVVAACLEGTWSVLEHKALAAATDRYDVRVALKKPESAVALRKLVASRLQPSYRTHGVEPPYESWPFAPEAFAGVQFTPRELLKRCSRHVALCVETGQVIETRTLLDRAPPRPTPVPQDNLTRLDRRFAELKSVAEVAPLTEEAHEDDLHRLLLTACNLLVAEQALPEGKDARVDRDFERTGRLEPLHARIRLVHRDQGEREQHYSFRILVHENPIAFQSRLNAAITAAGIDRALDFRKLRILRFTPPPGGPKTQETVEKFRKRGGEFVAVDENDLRQMSALETLCKENPSTEFDKWLRERRTASAIGLFHEVGAWLFGFRAERSPPLTVVKPTGAAANPATPTRPSGKPAASVAIAVKAAAPAPMRPPAEPAVPVAMPAPARPAAPTAMPPPAGPAVAVAPPKSRDAAVPVGVRVVAGAPTGEVLRLELEQLKRHVVVLAGAGSGKTVLIRRIVEEVALLGTPSIVIDVANDLATFGDRWPERPDTFDAADDAKADRYFASTETIVWTPGRSSGNPFKLEPLPDLSQLVDADDEYRAALDLALGGLVPWAMGSAAAGKKGRLGLLHFVLDWHVRHGRGGLAGLIDLLADLPEEASGGYANAQKQAREMADALREQRQLNPLLRVEGPVFDPAMLFGDDAGASGRTRISVVNLMSLATIEMQQSFVGQLATTLFSWIKAHPTPPDRLLRGLLVIDEAKDFVPSGKGTTSGAALIRLANQARKYGLGLVFATQAPKSIDHNVIANCATQFYGRASSPAALDVIREQLRVRGGGGGDDAAKLTKGTFYFASEGQAAAKIKTRLSLSNHPTNPLDESGVGARATESRKRLFPPAS